MFYNNGDLVQYKKYLGRVRFAYAENHTYIVTLFGYRGMIKTDRQISQVDLCPAYEQIGIRL